MFEKLIQLDHWLFRLINNSSANPVFDAVLPFVRESNIWIPLYLFMIIFLIQNFGLRGFYCVLGVVMTAILCDLVSSQLIKQNILRLRPCRDPEIGAYVRFLVKYCPQSSSFTSSHATNHFGVAMYMFGVLNRYIKGWMHLFFAWAAIICYAQVYVGVHFPLDVFCGALLGCALGYLTSRIFNKNIGLVSLQYNS